MRAYIGAGEDEDEIIVEIGELRVVVELLENLRLVSCGSRRDLVLEEATDLQEALLLWLP